MTHPYAQSAWGFREKRVRAAELVVYCNYFYIKKDIFFYMKKIIIIIIKEKNTTMKTIISTKKSPKTMWSAMVLWIFIRLIKVSHICSDAVCC